jgi:sugar O-acyltransferase (sialic acid O-acetyltransferase NeuD family)
MKKIILAGCGGFGQEIYGYIAKDIQEKRLTDIELVGVLDDSKESYKSSGIDLPLLGSIESYKFDGKTYVILCVGEVKSRAKLINVLLQNKGNLYTYIHSSCYIAKNSYISEGVIICPQSIINVNATVSSTVVINVHSSVGHGAHIGKGSVLSPYCALNGDASIGEYCFLGTRATIYPRVSLANNSIVDTHSAVKKTVVKPSVISDRANYICVPNRFF